jgi:CheY-like chemotaxis protein
MLIVELSSYGETGTDEQSTPNEPKNPIEERAKRCPFYAIMIDYDMPGLDGPTTAQKMREIGYTGVILGMAGSGNSSDEDIQRFLAHGADNVMKKPLDVEPFSKFMREAAATYNGLEVTALEPGTIKRLDPSNSSQEAEERKQNIEEHKKNLPRRHLRVQSTDPSMSSQVSVISSLSRNSFGMGFEDVLPAPNVLLHLERDMSSSADVRGPEVLSTNNNNNNNNTRQQRDHSREQQPQRANQNQSRQQRRGGAGHQDQRHRGDVPVRVLGTIRMALNNVLNNLFGRNPRVAPR